MPENVLATPTTLRFATFNLALTDDAAGAVRARLKGGEDPQARQLAAIIQRVRPDVILLNELDHDPGYRGAELFRSLYLAQGQLGMEAVEYPYLFVAPVNTGVASGFDLDRDGRSDGPADAWGFGEHSGQYGMVVLSQHPIASAEARTFQRLPWSSMPGALLTRVPGSDEPWYPDEVWAQLPLSSKSHWDLPIDTPLGRIHLLAAHPTPPAFDGPEQRNVLRNFDEIRLWKDYLDGADWIVDDAGRHGGLAADAHFVIAGDLNADPVDGSSREGAIQQLLEHARVLDEPAPSSEGSAEASLTFLPGNGVAIAHEGDPATDTAEFNRRVGNLRVDYALPSSGLRIVDSGVFWPKRGEPGSDWVLASDHRLVWIEVAIDG
ncbi:MAG: endonuclease/exonuclease/phosphatase family protein [Aquimonas sp.]|nr:endonuclease/exonuclease/phosphatase family protein [Aquimonas sp.]